jgi:hypothetical protein
MGHASGHLKSVTVLTYCTPPSAGLWLIPLAHNGQAEACLPPGLSLIRSASSRQGRGARTSLLTELEHSSTLWPSAVGHEHAGGRTGRRRRRRSSRLGCKGQDMGKVRQGKPVTKAANGGREAGRCRPCKAGTPLRR